MRCVLAILLSFLPLSCFGQNQKIDGLRIIVASSGSDLRENLKAFAGSYEAAESLESMLADESKRPLWPKVIKAIGLVSPPDERIYNRLVNFLESDKPFKDCPYSTPGEFLKEVLPIEPAVLSKDNYDPKMGVIEVLWLIAKRNPDDPLVSKGVWKYLQLGRSWAYWEYHLRWQAKEDYLSGKKLWDELARQARSAAVMPLR